MGIKISDFTKTLAALLLALFAVPLAAQSGREVAQGSEPFVYEVESLQNATGAARSPLDLDTPMGLLESFMDAGAQKDWGRAAAALDLENVGGEARDPDQLAEELYDLLHRSMAVDWASLPDRPDAVDTATTSNSGPPSAPSSASSVDISSTQGGHQVAQTLSRTVRPRKSSR